MRRVERVAIRVGKFLSWGFLLIALIMVYEVVARYVFGAPTFWAHDIAGLLAAFAFVAGGAFCMVEDGHMRVDVMLGRAGPRWRGRLDLLGYAAGAVYLSGMAWAAGAMSERSLFRFAHDGTWMPERSGNTWNTPAPGLVKFALFLGAVLFLAVVIMRAIDLLRGVRR